MNKKLQTLLVINKVLLKQGFLYIYVIDSSSGLGVSIIEMDTSKWTRVPTKAA